MTCYLKYMCTNQKEKSFKVKVIEKMYHEISKQKKSKLHQYQGKVHFKDKIFSRDKQSS